MSKQALGVGGRPDGLIIRRAARTDLSALCRIEASAFDAALYDRTSPRQWRYQLSRPNIMISLAEMDGLACGAAVIFSRRNSPQWRLYSLAVDPACAGRGIARALLHDSMQQARDAGAASMTLEVRPDNARALALYTAAGFTPTGQKRPDYYPDHAPALHLRSCLQA